MTEKKKIFVIADHPFAKSGVGTQTKYIIEALLKTGRYKFVCFGGAVKHQDYRPQKTDEWGDDLVIHPVDGYGTQEQVRSILWMEKPDALWFMTDPRFYGWLWDMENEIRSLVPMIYYHVWDNYPYPKFNKNYYNSNDLIVSISKVTHDIVNTVSPGVENIYLPHAVNTDIFKRYEEQDVNNVIISTLPPKDHKRFRFFWNNRNARRKMSGSVLWWFNEWAEKVGPENVQLIMHTDPKDPNGQDLEAIIQELGSTDGRIVLSKNKYNDLSQLSMMYNICDCVVNISDAEGFGLATLEGLACEKPIIVNMTGGLQEQVRDEEGNWFGVGIEPASRAIIGSQEVPYIYEDRISKEDFHHALTTIYTMDPGERKKLGLEGRNHVLKNYNFENYTSKWVEIFDNAIAKHGSWDTRQNYQAWELREIV
jgi:glycosyltransferase involved in cell wall biosynthesis